MSIDCTKAIKKNKKRTTSLQNPPQGKMRSVLHCNRFQMVLETEADSEHRKKSVNLGKRTKSTSWQTSP